MEFLKLATWQDKGHSGCALIRLKSCSLIISFMKSSILKLTFCQYWVSQKIAMGLTEVKKLFQAGFILQVLVVFWPNEE